MFFRKKIPSATAKQCKTKIDLKLNCVPYDFEHVNNVLATETGLNSVGSFKMTDIYPAKKILAYKDGWYYAILDDGVYACWKNEMKRITGGKMSTGACVEYNRNIYFSSESIGVFRLNTSRATQMYDKGFNSMAICGDRLVAVDSQGVVVCPAGEHDGWYKSQTINTHDPCDAVVAIGTKLYVLGDTCYVLEPSAEDIDIKFYPFAHQMGQAFADSVVRIGKRAVYATGDGLRMLSSDKVTPIFTNLNNCFNFTDCVACEHQGKYYVSCHYAGLDDGNNVLLILDVDKLELLGMAKFPNPIDSLFSDGSDVFVVTNNFTRRLVANTGESVFYRSGIDMGSLATKYLDYLVIKSKTDVNIWIETDGEKRLYAVRGKNSLQKIPVRGKGREFAVEIQSTASGMALERVELIAHTYEV